MGGVNRANSFIVIYYDSVQAREEFGEMNTTTGVVTFRGVVGDLATWSGQSIMDGNTLYVLGNSSGGVQNLYVLDTVAGTTLRTVPVGSTYGYYLGGVNRSGSLIVIYYDGAQSREEFGAMNTTTGAVTFRGVVGDLATWSGQSQSDGDTLYVIGNSASVDGKLYIQNSATGAPLGSALLGTTYNYFIPKRQRSFRDRAIDFDGDGKADPTVFNAPSALWYIRRSSDNTVQAIGYGASGYTTVPADYDGDGITDLAVYDASSGLWFVRNSTTLTTTTTGFGGVGYAPVRGDFTGDGKTDLATFHAASGLWYIKSSSDGVVTSIGFGGSGYTPMPGDYDADGITDIALYHEPSGLWFIRNSSTLTTTTVGYGGPGYKPVRGDFSGDGKNDLAVLHTASGLWSIKDSKTGTETTTGFGDSSSVPVPEDYEGDRKIDLGVYYEASGLWYYRSSRTGVTTSVGHGGFGYTAIN
jgi:hypothetical protein